MKMAWKLENIRKDPNSKELYADLFISQIKEEPKTACLFTVGDARTVEIILEKHKNTQFVVFDYPALIKFLDFAKPANLFKAIPLKYDWESEAEFLKFIEVEMQKILKEIEEANMSFDLIIANPPYGKSSSLSKKIVNKMLESKVAKEMVVLAPKNTCKNENISNAVDKAILIKENPFADASFAENTLCVFHTGTEKGNIDWVSFYLTPKSVKLYKAVQAYNKTHTPCFTVVDGSQLKKKFQCKIPELSKKVWTKYKDHLEVLFRDRLNEVFSPKSEGIFVKTIWTPENGVHFGDAHDTLYNYGKKEWDTNWEKDHRIDLFLFPNEQYKNNFRDWWYSITKTSSKKVRAGLTNAFLDLNRDYVGAGAESFLETFPNLDWSKSWTDQEILRELGLPEDFLNNF